MRCPICVETSLMMSDRQGIEVDYCPQCRGVWLDRGELDKIIERSNAPQAPMQTNVPEAPRQQSPAQWQQPPAPTMPQQQQPYRRDYDDDDDHRYDPRRKKKRGGFLGELFDFD